MPERSSQSPKREAVRRRSTDDKKPLASRVSYVGRRKRLPVVRIQWKENNHGRRERSRNKPKRKGNKRNWKPYKGNKGRKVSEYSCCNKNKDKLHHCNSPPQQHWEGAQESGWMQRQQQLPQQQHVRYVQMPQQMPAPMIQQPMMTINPMYQQVPVMTPYPQIQFPPHF
uniref:Female-specific protein transformer n=1 Tax=Caenorhabditis tropicalis TaxID=1561998 RepID=A0A1I7TLW8_9PELO